jgi:hypothetical protein
MQIWRVTDHHSPGGLGWLGGGGAQVERAARQQAEDAFKAWEVEQIITNAKKRGRGEGGAAVLRARPRT